jgi:acyl-[acyl-carrier-protein]-phospholipid O-acyltransferase / long-chain-fatty-acid--[acyl-carrier-protein] ligase
MSDESPRDEMTLPRRFLRMCRAAWKRLKVADSTGVEMTGGQLLTRTLILRRVLRREVLSDDERFVGLLLPPSAGGVLANAALTLDRRVPVNLNYTASSEVVESCIRQCGIRRVLTSRQVVARLRERFGLEVRSDLVYLEDVRRQVTAADKLLGATMAWGFPLGTLEAQLGLTEIDPDDLLTVVFTAGSTGEPKGVMLTHRNVGSNIEAFNHTIHLRADDVLLGILPLFHSFGFTVALWTVLSLEPMGIYHYTPLEAREVGKLAAKYGATLLIGTPTFLRSYLRRCDPEDFASLQVVIAGAEKLPVELAAAFEKRFGVRPVEGYGATELSPVVSVNVPPARAVQSSAAGVKEGTVGRPLRGIRAKVVDLDTGEDLGTGRSGMLLITGPNVMKGYLNRAELTAEALRDGWYVTGDVATIDEDGFITITGRLARFSKIGGEMVPHIRIEEALIQAIGADEENVCVAVTAVSDPKKGERLIVLHTGLPAPAEQICRRLAEGGLPALWIPSPDSFHQIDEIPVLGAGKTDLKRIRAIADELTRRGGTG